MQIRANYHKYTIIWIQAFIWHITYNFMMTDNHFQSTFFNIAKIPKNDMVTIETGFYRKSVQDGPIKTGRL